MIPTEDLLKALESLEARECQLLCWGDTGAYFAPNELHDCLEAALPDRDPLAVEDALRAAALIVPVVDAREAELGVRTRMAETVHLLRNLRQWRHGQDLEQSRTLVSDYRFVRKRRVYPRRDIALQELVAEWAASGTVPAQVLAAAQAFGARALAGFQARATERLIRAWQRHSTGYAPPSGTIVSAGTGSGKTMAFYLPVLASLAASLSEAREAAVRVLAIYPRTELLKDQFSETYQQARLLDGHLASLGARPVRIGALFGDTPRTASDALPPGADYAAFRFLKCPNANCRGEMRWLRSDLRQRIERVQCHVCHQVVTGDEVALTRDSMQVRPPDILFTTTEMLNQRMTDVKFRHLFGVGVSTRIPLVLLDEAHTYAGTSGAQVSLLLRRWMRLSGNRPHFVGLSATLRDAEPFFATLTGVDRARIELVQARTDEMIEEGAEYLLALRGDPVSQTALLSTTIQTTMLVRRMLDSRHHRVSRGVWGTKTLVFTDDLDVNNRLFASLADAEGWRLRQGRLDRNAAGPLAKYRNPVTAAATPAELQRLGQDWSVAKRIGHPLDDNDRSRVSRTSSQDAGYDRASEIVITTASLEVGFNDPDVGAVIQHKAPRGVSSYLQRKGRAGRVREQRPWMVCVLSDFGRDRVAYQQYERLVDPEIEPSALPVGNIHLLKIHAAQSVLDWLSVKVPEARIWNWFNQNPPMTPAQRRTLAQRISATLAPGAEQSDLSGYIASALDLDARLLDRVLWQAPRSVFLEFLPTLKRQLETNWAAWDDDQQAIVEGVEASRAWRSPAPEFIPSNLFSELNAPDLQVRLVRPDGICSETMPFFQGLKEFAPGRVSKRFAVESGSIADWTVPDGNWRETDEQPAVPFQVQDAFGPRVAAVSVVPASGGSVTVFQPRELHTRPLQDSAVDGVGDTSNAFLRWSTQFIPPDEPESHPIPDTSEWRRALKVVQFFTHAATAPLELIRFSNGSDAQLKLRDGTARRLRFTWVNGTAPAAVGARLFVDGALLRFDISESDLQFMVAEPRCQRAIRTGLLHDTLAADPVFAGDRFAANWVFECFLAAVLLERSSSGGDLVAAIERVCNGHSSIPLVAVPMMLFQSDLRAPEDAEDGSEWEVRDQRLQQALRQWLGREDLRVALTRAATCLYQPLNSVPGALRWAREVLSTTLSAGIHQAICSLMPDVDERSVYVEPGGSLGSESSMDIWVTEAETGGLGVISQLRDEFIENPRTLLNALSRALAPGDYEQLDEDLYATLQLLARSHAVADTFEAFRQAAGYSERAAATRRIREHLSASGIVVTHAFSAVLHSRLLKSGSSAASDTATLAYLQQWRQLEADVGFDVPLSVGAVALAASEVGVAEPHTTFERSCAIQSALWVRGAAARQASLGYFNPFQPERLRTERLLASVLPQQLVTTVPYTAAWIQAVHTAIDTVGEVELIIGPSDGVSVSAVVAELCVHPLDLHGLFLYPQVRSIRRHEAGVIIRIELAEAEL